jgi:hypothetical protein
MSCDQGRHRLDDFMVGAVSTAATQAIITLRGVHTYVLLGSVGR